MQLYKNVLHVCVIFSWTPLYTAVVNGRLDVCVVLLQHGADPNLQTNYG